MTFSYQQLKCLFHYSAYLPVLSWYPCQTWNMSNMGCVTPLPSNPHRPPWSWISFHTVVAQTRNLDTILGSTFIVHCEPVTQASCTYFWNIFYFHAFLSLCQWLLHMLDYSKARFLHPAKLLLRKEGVSLYWSEYKASAISGCFPNCFILNSRALCEEDALAQNDLV